MFSKSASFIAFKEVNRGVAVLEAIHSACYLVILVAGKNFFFNSKKSLVS